MTRIQSSGQQAVSRDDRQIKVILNRDESSFRRGVDPGNRRGIGRINYRQVRGFQDDLRLEVPHFVELMNYAVECLLPHDHPESLLAPNSDSVRLDLRAGSPFVGEWVKWKRSS